jgi:hypothetical protein
MNTTTLRAILVATLLAIVSSYIVYFGFTTNYTIHAFSPASFKGQYDHNIYKYRILSKQLLLFTDRALDTTYPEKQSEIRLQVMDRTASQRFYYAYYYLNTAFLILASIVLVLILNLDNQMIMTQSEKALFLFLIPILIALTQYVVCPYDISSYFFQLLTIWIFLKYYDKFPIISLFLLCALLILSTLNRESSALSVSLLFVMLYSKYGFSKRTIISGALIAISFLATYCVLRLFITEPNESTLKPDYLDYNINYFINNLGLLFWGLYFYLSMTIANSDINKTLILLFHLVSLPYIWTCFTAGVLWETRLYIPLFLGSLILSKIDTSGFKLKAPSWLFQEDPKLGN